MGDTALNWQHSKAMAEIGHLAVTLDSEQFILGRSANLSIDVTRLSPFTTVHSVSTSLIQTTAQATCPSKYTVAGAISCKDLDDRTRLSDKYELYTVGPSVGPRMAGRHRPSRSSYVWRGHEATCHDLQVPGERCVPIDRSYNDGFGISAILSLPSPIIGAQPTTINENPAFSTISHHLEIEVDYSILNQDSNGETLFDPDSAPPEGPIRIWKLRYDLENQSDLSSATTTAAPPYSYNEKSSPRCRASFDPTAELESTKARRLLSLGWTTATLMRPVAMSRSELQESTTRHWEETAGMCACFDRIDVCGCDNSVCGIQIPSKEATARL